MPIITVHGIPNDGSWEGFKQATANKLVQATVRIKKMLSFFPKLF